MKRQVFECRGHRLYNMGADGKWHLAAIDLVLCGRLLIWFAFAVSQVVILTDIFSTKSPAPLIGLRRPLELTAVEKASQSLLEYAITPLHIVVDVVPPEEIKATAPLAYAYTQPYKDPCRIVLPAGMKIRFLPSSPTLERGFAFWSDPIDGDAIAHELLHCYRGDWHK